MIRIPLTQGKVALLDDLDADLALCAWYTFTASRGGPPYAARNVYLGVRRRTTVLLHREVWRRAHPGPLPARIDHRNGDGLDCRRENLRAATMAENVYNRRRHRNNRSGFKGVSWRPKIQRWTARIMVARREQHLGCFATAEDAARAYDAAARSAFGEFACVNFPTGKERGA